MKAVTRPIEKASMWITRAQLGLGEYSGRDLATPSGGEGKQTAGREVSCEGSGAAHGHQRERHRADAV